MSSASMSGASKRVYNFSAGPAALPLPVLEQAQRELLVLPGCGASVLEISHRSRPFVAIVDSAVARISRLLDLPDNYRVLFLQGGSRLQFTMVPQNLLAEANGPAAYLLTGSWGKKAAAEARKIGAVEIPWDGGDARYTRVPGHGDFTCPGDAAYLHFTSNETVEGVQFREEPASGEVPLVCDASSDFLSRPLDVSRYGLIYACAQKNAGPAGVTVVIVREDLLERASDDLPGYLLYRNHAENNSLYNTPPTFAVYLVELVAKWLEEDMGGLAAMAEVNARKAGRLYELIDGSDGFYRGHAAPEHRSHMNVTFRLPDESLEQAFLREAGERDLQALGGHRSVGGIRASIYNAMPGEGVDSLASFMTDFAARHARSAGTP